MVEFAGWEMPVYYSGINAEHRAVRTAAGLFDTSHMGEMEIRGPRAKDFLQRITSNDLDRITSGDGIYTALLNKRGGVIDDLIIYDFGERYLLCVNAGNKDKDFAWIEEQAGVGVEIEDISDNTAMLALQGPASERIISKLMDANIEKLRYMRLLSAKVAGVDCSISRTGYTGEDGFELFCPAEQTVKLWGEITDAGERDGLVPAGLGARDTLRIEMGYPLWGAELDEEHTPLESGIGWICRWDKNDFIGKKALIRQKEAGTENTIAGIEMLERGVPRGHYPVFDKNEKVGLITSGTMSPSLGVGIALARISRNSARVGNQLDVIIHDKPRNTKVVKLPFIEETSLERSAP